MHTHGCDSVVEDEIATVHILHIMWCFFAHVYVYMYMFISYSHRHTYGCDSVVTDAVAMGLATVNIRWKKSIQSLYSHVQVPL